PSSSDSSALSGVRSERPPPVNPSSRSRPSVSPLTLTELETLARSRHPVLLALLGARVARQQPFVLEPLAQLDVVFHQRPGDAKPHRPGLTGDAAAADRRKDIELICHFREDQRLPNLRTESLGGEERVER